MSLGLEILMSGAAVAFIVVSGCAVPLMFHLRRSLDRMTTTAEAARADLNLLVQDTRTLLQKTTDVATRLEVELDTVHHVVGQMRNWSDRADRIVQEVGAAIEPPILGAARNLQLLRTGVAAFVGAFFNHQKHHEPEQEGHHDQ